MVDVSTWQARGRYVSTPDGEVWATEAGSGPVPILLLHGFPTSSWDYAELIETLSASHRVVTFDFLGFGLSAKPANMAYSLFEQADVAELVARSFGVERARVVAHDMGTSVATELCARRERKLLSFALDSLVLMNGSIHIEMANLTMGQRLLRTRWGPLFARLTSRSTFKAQIRRVFARSPDDHTLNGMWDLMARAQGTARLPQIIGYTRERARFERRWVGALERLDVPTLVAWGRRDPVAILAIAERLAGEIPGARMVVWDDLGHYPQVEDPGQVARTLLEFWGS